MSERALESVLPGGPGPEGSGFESEGRDIGASLLRRLVVRSPGARRRRAATSVPEDIPAVRDLDPADRARLELAALVAPPPSSPAPSDGSGFHSQRTLELTNCREDAAVGLVLELGAPAQVLAHPLTGDVGPFQDVEGNGTSRIVLSNPVQPIGCAVSVRIKLRGAAAIEVLRWSWLWGGEGP